ncbi:MAG: 3-phosphoglycerate dehydrogenase [Acholeplasmataceae bacterium]|nr:MAG: 3-phosphoglycerate dehydrogenase [Acholeplasmataceae bacterium]
MRHIHCLNKISKSGLAVLPDTYQLTDQIDQADAILVRSAVMHDMTLPSSVLAVARAGAGVNNIPLDTYAQKGVVVFNTPGANANAVKELTLAGMLLAVRDIHGGMNWLAENRQDPDVQKTIEKVKSRFGGTEILGKTIGIIGLGAIGRKLAEACLALGMKVIGTDRNLKQFEDNKLPTAITLTEDKESLYQASDFISLNLPLNDSTRHLINKETLAHMKEGVIILNFARDALVHDDDLETAIQSGKVHRYVTDFPNARTANMTGVIAIPHLGASTEEAEDNCASMAANQVVDYIENGNLTNAVTYPDVHVGPRQGTCRIAIMYQESNGLSNTIQQKLAADHTIRQARHHMKSGYGYSLIDLEDQIKDDHIKAIEAFEGVIRVRVLV